MSLRDRRKERRAVAPIVRAVEGGHFDDMLLNPVGVGPWGWSGSERLAFAKRTTALLGRRWVWPRGAGEKAVRDAVYERVKVLS